MQTNHEPAHALPIGGAVDLNTAFTSILIPRVGTEWPSQHGIYAGIVRGEDGQQDYHLIVMPGEATGVTWEQAREWATTAGGGELPTRREQRILFVNAKDQFRPDWYWSNEQHASHSNYAWVQLFGSGGQVITTKGYEGRARAVRRLVIQ